MDPLKWEGWRTLHTTSFLFMCSELGSLGAEVVILTRYHKFIHERIHFGRFCTNRTCPVYETIFPMNLDSAFTPTNQPLPSL